MHRLVALMLLLATPAVAQPIAREQAMADLYLNVCLANNDRYEAVTALAKTAGWEAMDPSALPFPVWYDHDRPDMRRTWKVDGFVLHASPKALTPGGGHPVQDSCTVEGFDLDLTKIVAQMLTNKRLMHLSGKANIELMIADFPTPAQVPVTVMQFKANPRDQKDGRHTVLVIQRD